MTFSRQIYCSNYDHRSQEKVFLNDRLAGYNDIYKDSVFWVNFLKFKKDMSSKEKQDNNGTTSNINKNSKYLLEFLTNLLEAGLDKSLVIKIMGETINYFNISMKDYEILKVN